MMEFYKLHKGKGRTSVSLTAYNLGSELVVSLYNENAHIGAVAVGEYDTEHGRVSVSLITRFGHKDDVIAQRGAYRISKAIQKTSCVVAGIHLDNITLAEIKRLVINANLAISKLLKILASERF